MPFGREGFIRSEEFVHAGWESGWIPKSWPNSKKSWISDTEHMERNNSDACGAIIIIILCSFTSFLRVRILFDGAMLDMLLFWKKNSRLELTPFRYYSFFLKRIFKMEQWIWLKIIFGDFGNNIKDGLACPLQGWLGKRSMVG